MYIHVHVVNIYDVYLIAIAKTLCAVVVFFAFPVTVLFVMKWSIFFL